jgi:hypothetical protein
LYNNIVKNIPDAAEYVMGGNDMQKSNRKAVLIMLVGILIFTGLFTSSCTSIIDRIKSFTSDALSDTAEISSPTDALSDAADVSQVSSPAATEYTKGNLTADSLTSEYLNLKFTKPEGFIMATHEEIDQMVQFSSEIIFKDDMKTMIDYAKAVTVYEMFVQSPYGLPNASLFLEKVMSNMTVELYIAAVKSQLVALETIQYSVHEETVIASVAGQNYTVLSAQASYAGSDLFQDYYLRKQGDRIIGIIVTYTEDTEASKDELLDAFQPLR